MQINPAALVSPVAVGPATIIAPPDGTYFAGDNLNFQFNYPSAVTVTGTPRFLLDIGGSSVYATYISGSGTSNIVFRYTVAAGELDADGIGTTPILDFNGGDMVFANAQQVGTVLTFPDTSGVLVDGVLVEIDNIDANVALDGSHGITEIIDIVVYWNEAVNAAASSLTLDNGGTASYLSGNGTATVTYRYVVAASQDSPDLNVSTFNLGVGTFSVSGRTVANTIPAGQNLADNRAIVIETTSPSVSYVYSTNADAYYGVGNVITVRVRFSEIVNVDTTGGTPSIALDSGATVAYSSGTGTNELTFSYTVVAAQNSSDLDYVATNSLVLNGGTIMDSASNVADLTLAAPNAVNSISDNQTLIIDGNVPTIVQVYSNKADATYGVGVVIDIVVEFSENMTVNTAGGTPTLALNSGGTATYLSTSGDELTFRYTVLATQNNVDLDYVATNSLVLNGGTIRDVGTNNATLTLAAPNAANSISDDKVIVIDTTAATVAQVYTNKADATYTVGEVIDIIIEFSEAITVNTTGGTPTLALNSGGSASYFSTSGDELTFRYTVAAGDNAADLDYSATTSLVLNGGTIRDVAANNATLTLATPNAANSISDDKAVVISTVANFNGDVYRVYASRYTVGKVYVLGSFTQYGFINVGGIARLNSDLSLDTSFNIGGDGFENYSDPSSYVGARTILEDPANGDIYVGGMFTTYNNVTVNRLVRLNSDGTIDYGFNIGSAAATVGTQFNGTIGFDQFVKSMVFADDGTGDLYAAGRFTTYQGSTRRKILRLNTDGTVDGSFVFGNFVSSWINGVSIPADGSHRVDIAANATNLTYSTARLTAAGVIDPTVTLALNPDDWMDAAITDIYSPGKILTYGGGSITNRSYLARYSSTGTVDTSTLSGAPAIANTYPQILKFSNNGDGTMYMGGDFVTVRGTARNRLARINYSDFSHDTSFTIGTGFNDAVKTIEESIDGTGKLFVGGTFTSYNSDATKKYFTAINLIASGTVPTITNVTSTTANASYGPTETINVNITFSAAVTLAGGNAEVRLATGTTTRSAICTPQVSVTTLSCTYTIQAGDVSSDLDYIRENSLVLTTGATITGDAVPNNKASLLLPTPGAAGSLGVNKNIIILPLNTFNGPVYAITPSKTYPGKLYVGGNFTLYGNFTANRIIRLNSDLSVDGTFAPGTGFSGENEGGAEAGVQEILESVDGSGDIYVSGFSLTYQTITINRLVRLNNDASIDYGFNIGSAAATVGVQFNGTIGFNRFVKTMKMAPDTTGDIIVGGRFETYKGTNYYKVMRLNNDGTVDATFVFGSPIGTAAAQWANGIDISVDGNNYLDIASGAATASARVIRVNSTTGASVLTMATDPSSWMEGTLADSITPGSIIAYGNGSAGGKTRLIRYLADGTVDASLSTNPNFNTWVDYAMMSPFGDSDIYVGGDFTTVTGTARAGLARINYDGSLDAGFTIGTGFVGGRVVTMKNSVDGSKLYVAGMYTDYQGDATQAYFTSINLTAAGTSSPYVSNVTASTVDGTYYPTDVISVQVTFTENVNLVGTARVKLETGTTDREAVCVGPQANVLTLTCSYTVQFGDTSTDLDYVSARSLSLDSGSTLQAAAGTNIGNPAVLALPEIGATGSLRTNKALVILPNIRFNAAVQYIYPLANGKLYVAGDFTLYGNTAVERVVRLNNDLTLDATFNPSGTGPDAIVYWVEEAYDGTGDVYIRGTFDTVGATTARKLTRLNSDGTLDATWIGNDSNGFNSGSNVVECGQTYNAGLYCSGNFTSWAGSASSSIAKILPTGAIDATFIVGAGFTAFSTIWGAHPMRDGSGDVIAFTHTNAIAYKGAAFPQGITRIGATGTMDTTFNANVGVGFSVNAFNYAQWGGLVSDDGEKVYMTGPFLSYNNIATRDRQASINKDGTYDAAYVSFQNIMTYDSFSSIDGSGDVYFVGNVTSYNGSTVREIIKVNRTGTHSVPFNTLLGTGFGGGTPLAFGEALDGSGKIYVGGDFTSFSGDTTQVYFTTINSLASGVMPTITSVSATNANGTFTYGTTITIEINFSQAVTLAGGNAELILSTSPMRKAICLPQANVTTLICTYTIVIGDSATDLEYFDIRSLYLTSGATLLQFAAPNNKVVLRLPPVAGGNSLGSNKNININPVPTFDVTAMDALPANDGSGDVWVVGQFNTYGDVTVNRAVRLNSDLTIDAAYRATLTGQSTKGFGTGCAVNSLAAANDGSGDVYMGGNCTEFGGDPHNGVIRLRADGTVPGTWDSGLGFAGTGWYTYVYSTSDGSGKVYLAGAFSSYDGGAGIPTFVRLNNDGTRDTGFNAGAMSNSQGNGNGSGNMWQVNDGTGDVIFSSRLDTQSGNAHGYNGWKMWRMNSSGTAVASFMTNQGTSFYHTGTMSFSQAGFACGQFNDGSFDIMVMGGFSYYNGNAQSRVVKVNNDGTFDNTFVTGTGPNAGGACQATFDGSGDMLFANNGTGVAAKRVVRINSNGTADATDNFNTVTGTSTGAGDPYSIEQSQDEPGVVYVTGTFTSFNGISTSPYFAKIVTATAGQISKVTNVSSTTADGSYTSAAAVNVRVTFSHPVTITGNPRIFLNSSTTAFAVCAPAASVTVMDCTYTVAAAEVSADLDYDSVDSLILNGGSITTDSSAKPAHVRLPPPATTGSLKVNKAIVIF